MMMDVHIDVMLEVPGGWGLLVNKMHRQAEPITTVGAAYPYS